ncbi:polysaccharide export protein Wza [Hartmannibacter diazotrophicus]|uniref:Polysaccharide export protein Wza n=1 Tax=Hartmannibacter diazotrophicus TaxID=1482074 RepID=A0A2C9D0A6_9HYPH|nr:polysaccharide biosynthesis/export family protein [Hartmannibacter diazotrophicus]SON53598.1 polysaccharide export protein Wza [Hartmannibacter diazotrophicus]
MQLRIAVLLTVSLALGSCSALPSEGPSASSIRSDSENPSPRALAYELMPLSPDILAILSTRDSDDLGSTFGKNAGGSVGLIGVGDVVSVTIWEAGSGGLFASSSPLGGAVATGANSAQIPQQIVNSDGTIVVPYAGQIRAAGRTPQAVKADIENALIGKAIEPQVLVTVTTSVANTVTVTGPLPQGGRIPLTPRGDHLLDVIALAGGVQFPAYEAYVTVNRGNRVGKVSLQKVINNPSENISVAAGDVITISREPKSFTSFGATGGHSQIDFGQMDLNLSQALAKAGGLSDARADPAGVFVYRMEDRNVVARLNPQSKLLSTGFGSRIPVIYELDLRSPSGLFLAQNFEVASGDAIYVANARLTELQKFLALIGTVISPVSSVATTSRAISTMN